MVRVGAGVAGDVQSKIYGYKHFSRGTASEQLKLLLGTVQLTAFLAAPEEDPGGLISEGENISQEAGVTNEALEESAVVDEYTNSLTELANEAVPAGNSASSAANRGTLIHTSWEELAKQKYGSEVDVEQSFLEGNAINRNVRGSVRVDLIIKPPSGEPIGIFDLKTGRTGLTPARINQIRNNLPQNLKDLPIKEIRPTIGN